MNLAAIDPNFKPADVGGVPVQYVNALAGGVFRLTGFPWRDADGTLRRLPWRMNRQEVNQGALYLAQHTSGGQLAFRTDSRYIAIRAVLNVAPHDMNHMPRTGSSGFDFMERTAEGYVFRKVVGPAPQHLYGDVLEQMAIPETAERVMRSWRINFPLYGGVRSLEIGLEPDCSVEEPEPFRVEKPVLLYGGSIIQGGCAGRPGNSLGGLLCRELDAPQINLGFSGSGLGEAAIAREIAELDLAALIMGCELNSPTPEFLRDRLIPFHDTIRVKHPALPIIYVTQGDYICPGHAAVVREMVERANGMGDANTMLVTRTECFGELPDPSMGTVDGCHPNDLGFYCMYRKVLPVLKKALGL